jgi:hypothetical protein
VLAEQRAQFKIAEKDENFTMQKSSKKRLFCYFPVKLFDPQASLFVDQTAS